MTNMAHRDATDTEQRRLTDTGGSLSYCAEGRGWRLGGDDSFPDFDEYRTDIAGTESRDLGRQER